jgi:hypothetical protein
MNLIFGTGGEHFEHFITLNTNTITLSLFICLLRASKVCIHVFETLCTSSLKANALSFTFHLVFASCIYK